MKRLSRKMIGLIVLIALLSLFLMSVFYAPEPEASELENSPLVIGSLEPSPTQSQIEPTQTQSPTPAPPPTQMVVPGSSSDIIPSITPGPSTMTDIPR